MNQVLIKLTAVGCQTSTVTQYFSEAKTVLINPFKIMCVITNKKGVTEIRDEAGRNTVLVKESPEEIYEMLNKN